MSIAFNGMPIGVTASSKIILLTNIIFRDKVQSLISQNNISSFQQSDIENRKYQKIYRHNSDTDILLQISEDHRHKCTSDVGRSHLQSDHSCTVTLPEVCRSHMLDCGIYRPHTGSYYRKSDSRRQIMTDGKHDKDNPYHFNNNAYPYQRPVPQLI